jgi:hypothetical protein
VKIRTLYLYLKRARCTLRHQRFSGRVISSPFDRISYKFGDLKSCSK